MTQPSDVSGKIALCLSGGGLRATLFHLGLVKALRSHTQSGATALASVCEIYSVSGGSIIAAHLVRNWPKYVGTDEEYLEMERELLDFCALNIRDRVIRRWLLTRWAGKRRTYWLQKQYEHLLGSGPIGQCYGSGTALQPPDIYILATSFKTGELCSFSKQSFDLVTRGAGRPTMVSAPGDQLPLAFAVTASSAFPPLFPPVALTPYMLGNPEEEEFAGVHCLSDGGVFDNFGIDKFRLNAMSRNANPGTLLVSQAGGSFKSGREESYSGTFSRNIRASDIMMRRVGENTEASAASIAGVRPVSVRISDSVNEPGLAVVTQRRLRQVRTDLDRFDPELAKLLVDHGYRVGSKALVAEGWAAPDDPQYLTRADDPERLDQIAGLSAGRRFLSLAMDFRDWATTPLLWAIALLVAASAYFLIRDALNEQKAQRTADKRSYNSRLRPTRLSRSEAPMFSATRIGWRRHSALPFSRRRSWLQILGWNRVQPLSKSPPNRRERLSPSSRALISRPQRLLTISWFTSNSPGA